MVALSGGSGFLGGACLEALVRTGAQVGALQLPDEPVASSLAERITVTQGDVRDEGSVQDWLATASDVLHIAGPPSVLASFEDPEGTWDVHVNGTRTVLEAAREAGVRRFVYVSSAEVYGHSHGPVAEHAEVRPRSPYGQAKAAAEALVRDFAPHFVSAVILRPFSVYGPRAARSSVTMEILRQLLEADEVKLRDGSVSRDFCYVGDVARAVVAAREAPPGTPLILNVGTGRPTRIRTLARQAATVAGTPEVRVEEIGPRLENDLPALIADHSAISTHLGWVPTYSLADGLRATLDWLRGEAGL